MDKSLEERFPSFFRKYKRPVAWQAHCYDETFCLGWFSIEFDDYKKFCELLYDYRTGLQSYTTHYEDGTSDTTIVESWD